MKNSLSVLSCIGKRTRDEGCDRSRELSSLPPNPLNDAIDS